MKSVCGAFCVTVLSLLLGISAYADGWPQSIWLPSDIKSFDAFSSKDAVSKSDFLNDLDSLERTMQAGYSGWSVNESAVKSAFSRLRSTTGFPLSSNQICQLIGREFLQIPDGHLAVSSVGVNCGAQDQLGQVGKNLTTQTWQYFESVKNAGVPVVAIKSMDWTGSTTWDGFLPKIEDLKANAKALIIDLRGNGGGDMEKAQQMARRLFGIEDDTIQISPPSTMSLAQTPAAFAIAGNMPLWGLIQARLTNSPPPQGDEEGYKSLLDQYNLAVAGNPPSNATLLIKPFVFDKTKVFQGPIRILVDRECASSCEWAVMFFERHPQVKVIGERTHGEFHFDNVGMTWMRNTNLIVMLPTISVKFVSQHPVSLERQGLKPDILVPEGIDALDVALKDIKSGI